MSRSRVRRRLETLGFFLALAGLGAILFVTLKPSHRADLTLHGVSANPRYFADGAGAPVYLTGSHTWADLVDLDTRNPPRPFDYSGFLSMLERNGNNFFRLWTWEQPHFAEPSGSPRYADPLPWARTGPGTANDGLPRFDLRRFDARYFERLRSRVLAAEKRGIYVAVMLFEGWELHRSKPPFNWRTHPFNRDNNVNGIRGDIDGDGSGTEVHTLADPRVTALQERYVRKVVDTVHDLGNVLFEISNESAPSATRWQYHMIDVVKQEEDRLGVSRPVGMTSEYGADNATLWDSPADWISPSGSIEDPPAADGRKVVLLDTDHLCGVCGDGTFVFKAFFRGYNPIYMDPITGTPEQRAQYESARRAMGETARLARRIDLSVMTPQPSLFSTGYGLAAPGLAYLAYQPRSGPFSVDLRSTRGPLSAEWIDPGTGRTTRAASVVGGARHTFDPPLGGQAVLLLQRQ